MYMMCGVVNIKENNTQRSLSIQEVSDPNTFHQGYSYRLPMHNWFDWDGSISLFRNMISKIKKTSIFQWYYIHRVRGGQYKRKQYTAQFEHPGGIGPKNVPPRLFVQTYNAQLGWFRWFWYRCSEIWSQKSKRIIFFNDFIYIWCGVANIKESSAQRSLSIREVWDPKMSDQGYS